MALRASDNLRCYIQGAKLPVMAYRSPRGEPSGSFDVSLNVRPERYRKLRLVHTINATLFGDMISDCSYDPQLCVGRANHQTQGWKSSYHASH